MGTTTIILLSVLSTLSVVAVITIVVVSFSRLRSRVDSNNDECYRQMDAVREEFVSKVNELENIFTRESDEIRRVIDSRCDKLDSKIKSISESGPVTSSEKKQVLQG
ncbi:MAG TPA: hypothetical protein VMZ91_06070 [Candidatus Paceibacterota bacterium]|nr:hypothetical protein [Candidatus Paceibacterota bacterium]